MSEVVMPIMSNISNANVLCCTHLEHKGGTNRSEYSSKAYNEYSSKAYNESRVTPPLRKVVIRKVSITP